MGIIPINPVATLFRPKRHSQVPGPGTNHPAGPSTFHTLIIMVILHMCREEEECMDGTSHL